MFPDSSGKIITITGTGHGGEGTQTMRLDVPSALVLDIGSRDARGFSQTMSRNVVLSSENNDMISVETDAAWLNVDITRGKDVADEHIYSVNCAVNVSDGIIKELCENEDVLNSKVTVTGKPSGRQVQFDVVLRRDPLVTAAPNTISILKEQKGTIKIQTSDFVKSRIKDVKINKIQNDNTDVTCDLQRIDDISYQAEIVFTSGSSSKYQLIRFDVEFENGMRDSILVLATLKNK
jgi:hypothetical protein